MMKWGNLCVWLTRTACKSMCLECCFDNLPERRLSSILKDDAYAILIGIAGLDIRIREWSKVSLNRSIRIERRTVYGSVHDEAIFTLNRIIPFDDNLLLRRICLCKDVFNRQLRFQINPSDRYKSMSSDIRCPSCKLNDVPPTSLKGSNNFLCIRMVSTSLRTGLTVVQCRRSGMIQI